MKLRDEVVIRCRDLPESVLEVKVVFTWSQHLESTSGVNIWSQPRRKSYTHWLHPLVTPIGYAHWGECLAPLTGKMPAPERRGCKFLLGFTGLCLS